MYEDRYGTGWQTLDTEEAIERAYALGVLSELATEPPDEYERIRAETDSAPANHMVELAYREGRQAVLDHDAPEQDDEDAWTQLLAADSRVSATDEAGDGNDDAEDAPTSAPPSSLSALESPDMDPDMFDFPDFLK